MKSLNHLLNNIINENQHICSLCLSQIEAYPIYRIQFDDIVITDILPEDRKVSVGALITYLFGEEMCNNLSTFDNICRLCATNLINSYKFIIETKNTHQIILNLVQNLSTCFDDVWAGVEDNKQQYNALFLTVNQEGRTVDVNQLYDNQRLNDLNKEQALQRFLTITKNLNKAVKEEIEFKKPEKIDIKTEQKNVKSEGKENKQTTNLHSKTLKILYNPKDPSNAKCKECEKTFSTINSLRNHYTRCHEKNNYKCTSCRKSFRNKDKLKKHVCVETSYICTTCGRMFRNKQTWQLHEETHYKQYVCPDCGRIYKNRNTFKKHKDFNVCQQLTRRTQADAKYECDHCGKKYTQKMSLRVHIQYEHLNYKYHHCKWCSKKFWCEARLKAHIVKHTRERNFTCTQCQGKFVSKLALLYHTRLHTGERPYKCDHCELRFISISRRTAHMKSQHLPAVLECNICQSKFKSNHYLQKHKKIHFESNETLNPDKQIVIHSKLETVDLKNINKKKNDEERVLNPEQTQYVVSESGRSSQNQSISRMSDVVSPGGSESQAVYLEVSDDDYVIYYS